MTMNNPAQAYQTNSVTTASPGELTLMLYNGGLKFVKQAKVSLLENKLDKSHEYNMKAQSILNELIITLNRDIPIAESMLLMYDYMLRRLIEANLKKDAEILDEVEGLFTQFRDTWKEALLLAKN